MIMVGAKAIEGRQGEYICYWLCFAGSLVPAASKLSSADGGVAAGSQNLLLVKRVVAIAEKKGCTPGQLALAWVQVRPSGTPPPRA